MEKGGEILESSKNDVVKTLKMKCPECLNYVIACVYTSGAISGNCKVCKHTFIQTRNSIEKLIRILN